MRAGRAAADDDRRAASREVARALRARGIATEVAPSAAKFGRQIRHADRRGIPYVWFPRRRRQPAHQVKDIRSGDQVDADPARWEPPADDLRPRLAVTTAPTQEPTP